MIEATQKCLLDYLWDRHHIGSKSASFITTNHCGAA